jgi:hypothetical protein
MPVDQLIAQGGMGLLAGVFLWLFLQERSDHKQTRKEKDALLEARRLDAREVTDNVTKPLKDIAQTQQLIYDKLLVSKARTI